MQEHWYKEMPDHTNQPSNSFLLDVLIPFTNENWFLSQTIEESRIIWKKILARQKLGLSLPTMITW